MDALNEVEDMAITATDVQTLHTYAGGVMNRADQVKTIALAPGGGARD